MRIAKVRGADNSLIFGSTDFGWLTNIKEIMGWEYFWWAGNILVWMDLTLGSSFEVTHG